MGLLTDLIVERSRERERQNELKYQQKIKNLEYTAFTDPDASGDERTKAAQDLQREAKIFPGEDQQRYGGLFGAIGHLIHRHAQAEKQIQGAAQAQFPNAPPPTLPPPAAFLPPGFSGAGAGGPGDQSSQSVPFPFLPSPADVSRGIGGAANAVSGTGPAQPAPVNASAGAGAASPLAQDAAMAPSAPPAPPPASSTGTAPALPPPPVGLGTGALPTFIPGKRTSIPERTAAIAGMTADVNNAAKRRSDAAFIEQNRQFMQQNPDLFKDLQPFQRLEFLRNGNIQRGAAVGKGPVIQKPDGTFAQQITDPYTGEILGERPLGGVPTTAARERVSGAPFLDPNDNQWKVNIVDFSGNFVRSQPLGGTPSSVVVAGAPQTSNEARQGFQQVTLPDGSTALIPVTTTEQATRQRQVPGGAVPAAPGTPGISLSPPPTTGASGRPAVPAAPRSAGASVGKPIATGGVKAPLTADQRASMETNVKAVDQATISVRRLLDNLSVLDNPLVAGAIQVQADPSSGKISTLIASQFQNDPKVQTFAAALTDALDGINTVRKVYGGVSRSKEGWEALQNLVGANKLLGNKGTLRRVLTKTLQDMNAVSNTQRKYVEGPNPYTGETGSTLPPPPGSRPPLSSFERQ